jgi:polar amino acid transport system substrate-binding protein
MRKKMLKLGFILILILSIAGCSGTGGQPDTAGQQEKSGNGKMSTVDDLKDKRIGVLLGSVYDEYAAKTYPQAQILQYKSPSDTVLALKSEKIDAAIYTHEAVLVVLRDDDSMAILGENLFRVPIGMGFNQDNDGLREQFNTFLAEVRQNGVIDDMAQRWVIDGKTEMPVIDNAKNNGKLVVGWVSDKGMPFALVMNNRPVGFDMELCERFAAYLGKELVLEDMEFGSLIPAAAGNKIDMIASTLILTEERAKQIDFSEPYYEMGASAFALKKNMAAYDGAQTGAAVPAGAGETAGALSPAASTLSTVDDLKDKRIGVLLGSIHDAYVQKTYPQAEVLQYKNVTDLILAVKNKKADAILVSRETLEDVMQGDDTLGFLNEKLFSSPMGIAFNRDNDSLREQFNLFLAEIKQNGVYDDMRKRWMTDKNTEMPAIENPKNNGRLVVGTVSDKGMPFSLVVNNRIVGFDVEIAERFAAYLGKELVLEDMEFGSLIAAVAGNKIDMIAGSMLITEERALQVDFSDPYYEMWTSVVALKDNLAGGPNGSGGQPGNGSLSGQITGGQANIFTSIKNSFYSNIIMEQRYKMIIDGLKVTILISIFSVFFGTLLGALICFMRMSKSRLLCRLARAYISILRGIPVLVLLMIIFYVVFASVDINPVLVAVLAFGMNFAAYVSEMFRTSIQSIDKGQREAGIAIGFTPVQTFLYVILPQAVRQVLPVYKGEFISLVKMTSVVGYIAVQDLTKASDIIRSRTFDAFFPLVMVAVLYFIITWLLTLALDYLDRKTDRNNKRKAVEIQ